MEKESPSRPEGGRLFGDVSPKGIATTKEEQSLIKIVFQNPPLNLLPGGDHSVSIISQKIT